jgi:hypothetical protein
LGENRTLYNAGGSVNEWNYCGKKFEVFSKNSSICLKIKLL